MILFVFIYEVALQVLQSGKMISQLLKACQTLELSTQLSRYCGEAFAQAGASRILFALIRSCNRSTPHQELLRYAYIHIYRYICIYIIYVILEAFFFNLFICMCT